MRRAEPDQAEEHRRGVHHQPLQCEGEQRDCGRHVGGQRGRLRADQHDHRRARGHVLHALRLVGQRPIPGANVRPEDIVTIECSGRPVC